MDRVLDPELLDWLARSDAGGEVAGFDARGWDASVWILHAMYETDELPGGISHDDIHRIERAAGSIAPLMVGDVNVDELLSDAVLIAARVGPSGSPGPGWRRLLWTELGRRLDVDPFAIDVPPCYRSFPYQSWPANIAPPAEGSMDQDQFLCLVDHLAAVTAGGSGSSCFAYYAMCAVGEFDEPVIYQGELNELLTLYEDDAVQGSPSNIWPADKSWFVYTDWDLWATKVSGSLGLIERLVHDPTLETVFLDV